MSVLIDTDSQRNVQYHLDELSLRLTVLFVTCVVFTIFWERIIDEIMMVFLDHVNPCKTACMNLFDPAEWSYLRWLTSIGLSVFSITPLMIYHILAFSKPGLLPKEYKVLKRGLSIGVLGFVLITTLLIQYAIPSVYSFGHSIHTSYGLIARYNVTELLMISFLIIWITMLWFISLLTFFLLCSFGICNGSSADLWRLRVHGLISVLMMLSLIDYSNQIVMTTIIIYLLGTELFVSRWIQNSPPMFGKSTIQFDHEGRRRKLLMVDCSCLGANLHSGHCYQPGWGYYRPQSICTERIERLSLYEGVMSHGITDVVISGCDGKNLPNQFYTHLERLNVQCSGLNLMGLYNSRNRPSKDTNLEVISQIFQLKQPFSEAYRQEKMKMMLNSMIPHEAIIISQAQKGWKVPNELTIYIQDDFKDLKTQFTESLKQKVHQSEDEV